MKRHLHRGSTPAAAAGQAAPSRRVSATAACALFALVAGAGLAGCAPQSSDPVTRARCDLVDVSGPTPGTKAVMKATLKEAKDRYEVVFSGFDLSQDRLTAVAITSDLDNSEGLKQLARYRGLSVYGAYAPGQGTKVTGVKDVGLKVPEKSVTVTARKNRLSFTITKTGNGLENQVMNSWGPGVLIHTRDQQQPQPLRCATGKVAFTH